MRNTRGSLRLGATLFALSAGLGMVQYAAAAAPPPRPSIRRRVSPLWTMETRARTVGSVGAGRELMLTPFRIGYWP